MFRLTILSLVSITCIATAAPVPREETRPPVPLAGSIWEGDGVVAPTVYEFHSDGKMTATYKGQTYLKCGTWTQDGKQIYWETNNRYCEFEGTLTATTITGRAWNQPGGNWTLTFKRTKVEKVD